VIFATQSLSDVIESPIVGTLIDSCPTRIFMPNPKSLEKSIKDQYTQFGLNDKQLEIIANAIPKREYYCQSFYGNRLFELGLGPIALSLCASSSPEDMKKMRQLNDQNLKNRDLLIQFISYKKGRAL
jgi:type IV secretion system protein VirB4